MAAKKTGMPLLPTTLCEDSSRQPISQHKDTYYLEMSKGSRAKKG